MGIRYQSINEADRNFIAAQAMFFVATGAADSSINLSPKGSDTLRVLDANRVLWLNYTGSGNETAAHLAADGRITLMFCAFVGDPLILRLYGQGKVIHRRDARWDELVLQFGHFPSARQMIECDITAVQRSCGFTVPLMALEGERPHMKDWVAKREDEGFEGYWRKKNKTSIDGLQAYVLDETPDD